MTELHAGAEAVVFQRLSRPFALSIAMHGLLAVIVGAIAATRTVARAAPVERLLMSVSVARLVEAPVPVEVEHPPVAAATPTRAPETRAHPAAPRAIAPAPAAAPSPTPRAAPEAPAVVTAEHGDHAVATGTNAAAAPVMAPSAPAAPPTPTAAPSGDTQGPALDVGAYLSVVQARVSRHRRYPEMALEMGLEGVVAVRVLLNPDGSLAAAPAIDESSGHEILDQEALRIVARAAPFPAITGHHDPVRLRVPVRFQLDG